LLLDELDYFLFALVIESDESEFCFSPHFAARVHKQF